MSHGQPLPGVHGVAATAEDVTEGLALSVKLMPACAQDDFSSSCWLLKAVAPLKYR